MRYWLVYLTVLLVPACSLLPRANHSLDDISDFSGEPLTIALAPTQSNLPETATVFNIVGADLERSGRFKTLLAMPVATQATTNKPINFSYWDKQNISHVLVGSAQSVTTQVNLTFTLWDVKAKSQQRISDKTVRLSELRTQAHSLSDRIFSSVIGVSGSFSGKLVYVTANTEPQQRRYQLWLTDADGQNKKVVFTSNEPVMSPTWSPDGNKISFASLQAQGRQHIYIYDIKADTTSPIKLGKPGLIGAPAWSPDGKRLAFTLIQNGNADIFTLDLNTDKIKRLTCDPDIDTESAWSPDGQTIVFTSDRNGRPQLYEIPSNGGRTKRITFRGQENAQANISPNGKHIAMLHAHNGKYQIALLERKTGKIRILTHGELDESPSFSANGSMVIYSSAVGGKSALFAVSVDGNSQQQLSIDEDIRDPAWSPI